MTAALTYEAMNSAGAMTSRPIVSLHDNGMSIAPPVGAMAGYLARLFSGHTYRSLSEVGKQLATKLQKALEIGGISPEEVSSSLITGGSLFEEFTLYYDGNIEGCNSDALLSCL